MSLRSCMNNELSMSLFMEHLKREFSVENMLFYQVWHATLYKGIDRIVCFLFSLWHTSVMAYCVRSTHGWPQLKSRNLKMQSLQLKASTEIYIISRCATPYPLPKLITISSSRSAEVNIVLSELYMTETIQLHRHRSRNLTMPKKYKCVHFRLRSQNFSASVQTWINAR